MSPSTCKKKTEVISVVCSLSLRQLPEDVKVLEEQIVEVVNQAGRQFYAAAFAAYQQRWLQQRRAHYCAERWREINQVTPFGLIRLPVRVVRSRAGGHYLTLSKLLGPKATRLLSPLLEKRALEAATRANYRLAAAELWRWLGVRVSAWLVWRCVQFHGAKLSEQLDRQWWPDRATPRAAKVVVSEIDSTYLESAAARRQRRSRDPFSDPSGDPLQRARATLSKTRLALGAPAKQALDTKHSSALYLWTTARLATAAPLSARSCGSGFK
jgi:hypothetical protein